MKMDKDIIVEIKFLFLFAVVAFIALLIAERIHNNNENIIKICDKNNIEYTSKTNIFGNVTKIDIKE